MVMKLFKPPATTDRGSKVKVNGKKESTQLVKCYKAKNISYHLVGPTMIKSLPTAASDPERNPERSSP